MSTRETLETLLVQIEGSTSLLREELQRGGADIKAFASKTDADVSKVEQRFRGLGRNLAGVFGLSFSVAGLAAFTRSAVQSADAVGEVAAQAGMGAERFQRLQFVFKQNGVEANEFEAAMRSLNTRLGQFVTTGSGPAEKAIDQLGLRQRILNGEIRTSEQFFDAAVAALQNVKNESERAAIAASLFGREIGSKMAPVLARGTVELNKAAEAATGIFSDETVERGNQLADAWERISTAVARASQSTLINGAARLGAIAGIDELQPTRGDTLKSQIALDEATLARLRSGNATAKGTQAEQAIVAVEARLRAARAELSRFELEWGTGPFAPTGGAAAGPQAGDTSKGQELSPELRGFMLALEEEGRLATELAKGQQLSPELTEVVRQLEAADQLTKSMSTEVEKQVEQWQEAQRLFDDGLISKETLTRVQEDLLKPMDVGARRVKELIDEQRAELRGLAQDLGRGLHSTLRDMFLGIETSFSDLLKNMAAELAASAVLKGIGGLFAGASGGATGFLEAIFGGAFAEGGRPPVGRASIVGERGPEIFVPDVAGRILSNAQSRAAMAGASGAGGATVNINTTIDARGADPAAAGRLETVLGARDRRLKADIADLMRRKRL